MTRRDFVGTHAENLRLAIVDCEAEATAGRDIPFRDIAVDYGLHEELLERRFKSKHPNGVHLFPDMDDVEAHRALEKLRLAMRFLCITPGDDLKAFRPARFSHEDTIYTGTWMTWRGNYAFLGINPENFEAYWLHKLDDDTIEVEWVDLRSA